MFFLFISFFGDPLESRGGKDVARSYRKFVCPSLMLIIVLLGPDNEH